MALTPEMLEDLSRFREIASAEGIPADDVERCIGLARPCAQLDSRGDGPDVGRLGGPMMLPADAPDPRRKLAATVDLAALPADATDLDLPRDGHLLLFADPDPELLGYGTLGDALYIPAGTPVEERQVDLDPRPGHVLYGKEFPEGRLRLTKEASLPEHTEMYDPVTGRSLDFDRSEEEQEAWETALETWTDESDNGSGAGIQLGGYAVDECGEFDLAVWAGVQAAQAEERGDLPKSEVSIRPRDWVCLAQWWHGLDGLEPAWYFWAIARQDLAAGRFDRVYATMMYNP